MKSLNVPRTVPGLKKIEARLEMLEKLEDIDFHAAYSYWRNDF